VSLEVHGASVGYAGGRAVLDGLSLRLSRGECVAIVGPNGAGKSTLVKVLSGLLRPTSGSVAVDDVPLGALTRFERARAIAVVEQSPLLPTGFPVSAVVGMGRTPHLGLFGAQGVDDEVRVHEAMREAGVAALADRPVETLSGGERQRVVLARALAQGAAYLLLDEPTNHLDLRYQLEVVAFARRAAAAGSGVMLVLHDLNLAVRASDRVVVMADGRVAADGPPATVLTPALLSKVYGATVAVIDDEGVPVVVPRPTPTTI